MTQYDVGPGDWSDREWETGDRSPKPQAKRRRLALPPWALLVILVAAVIVLCVALVLIVRAIRADRGAQEAETPEASESVVVQASATTVLSTGAATTAPVEVPTATVVLPLVPTDEPAPTTFTEIVPGATVEVYNTGNQTLRLRSRATTSSDVLENLRPGTELVVLEGPEQSGGYTWWKVRTPGGKEGWAAGEFLRLKAQ